DLPGADDPRVMSYIDVLHHAKPVGNRVAVIGAGGIGFDVAEFLVEHIPSPTTDIPRWAKEWGVDLNNDHRGGLVKAQPEPPVRDVWFLQRAARTPGKRLYKSTGWVRRATLKAKRVKMLGGVSYEGIVAEGLHIRIDDQPQVLAVDTIVV